MKIFEITYALYSENFGGYPTMLVKAETAEEAIAYLKKIDDRYKIIECRETQTPPKLGQLVHDASYVFWEVTEETEE